MATLSMHLEFFSTANVVVIIVVNSDCQPLNRQCNNGNVELDCQPLNSQ